MRVIHKYSQKLNVNYFLELKEGHTYSRNRGIIESKGEYLAFIDDDAFVDVDYIENIKKAFSTYNIAALGGKITPRYESGNPPGMDVEIFITSCSSIGYGSK